ncbi:LysR family transcriptional regulator [Ottowia thiooxydans]|uniref:DNA-binding transcriptional LysR family regulator n=1 Tax=Ottowia thiooxydans TaxID=219182 RepID=A0ABV2Q693_9BURK
MTPFRGKLRARHLEVVVAVSELGNLSRAAEQLHMTQSGLSRAVAEVEEIVEGRLFDRTAKGMTCTDLGSALCRHALLLLSDMRQAELELKSISSGSTGNLVVGCFSMYASAALADGIARFMEVAPRVQIGIEVGSHESLIEQLDYGRIDLFISRSFPGMQGTQYRYVELIQDDVVLGCHPQHPLAHAKATLGDCVQYPWVSAPAGSMMHQWLNERIRAEGLACPRIVGVLSLELGRSLIMQGQMMWLLPGSIAQQLATRGEIVVLPIALNMQLGPLAAVWRRERSSTRAMREFIVALRKSMEHSYR